jgi:hypothetical protein
MAVQNRFYQIEDVAAWIVFQSVLGVIDLKQAFIEKFIPN